MIPIKARTNGAFGKRLKERIQKWAAVKQLAARIRVSEELRWWVDQEYGTATYRGKGKYPIEPNQESYPLRFLTADGTEVRTMLVMHPGVSPKRMVSQALPEIEEQFKLLLAQALFNRVVDNPDLLQEVLMQGMNQAKSLITASFAERLPGTSETGKLGDGVSAADAFDRYSTVEISE